MGDFFDAPHELIANIMMAVWHPNGVYPALVDQYLNILGWLNL